MMPRANTAKRVSAPPANRLRKSSTRLPRASTAACRASRSTPGTGTNDPKRKISRMNAVKSSFFLSSGERSEFRIDGRMPALVI
jgi:hypothetical protein